MASYDFSGKRALVTGASRGIGKEVVKQLVKYGGQVFALSKNPENLNALKAETGLHEVKLLDFEKLHMSYGDHRKPENENAFPSVTTICVDVADWKKTRELVEEIDDIDLLVNNAGIAECVTFAKTTEDQIDKSFAVNVKPIINVSQVVTEKWKKKNKPGSIVNVSSLSSLKTVCDLLPYSVSKAALDKLTKMMAVELASHKIRVNSVNPTATLTDMFVERQRKGNKTIEDIKKVVPLGDICTVEDVADSILFLLSDKSRMITGTILAIDGGRTAA